MAENDLEARLATISTGPGVYLLKDAHGKVIYVGKAVNLRSRVPSYVRGGDERSQVRFLVEQLADVETLVTANEKEALILENNARSSSTSRATTSGSRTTRATSASR